MAKPKITELNPALEDIASIVDTKPDLTPEEWKAVEKAEPWLKSILRPQIRTELEIEFTKQKAEFEDTLRKETQALVKANMEDWREQQKPLDDEELATLLSQEYIEFNFKIKIRGEDIARNFVISELPAEVEIKFVNNAQKFLLPLIEEINSLEWDLKGSTIEQISGFLRNLPSAIKVAASLVAVCLDPWEDKEEITATWVMKHFSVKRITDILNAQQEANRYRDFFLNGSRSFRSWKKS